MQFDPWPIWSKFTTLEQFWPVVDVIKLFWRKSWFSQNLAIEKHFWCQNLHKQSYFQAKLCSKMLMLLKWPILAVMASGEISIFKISSKKSFITSTTDICQECNSWVVFDDWSAFIRLANDLHWWVGPHPIQGQPYYQFSRMR